MFSKCRRFGHVPPAYLMLEKKYGIFDVKNPSRYCKQLVTLFNFNKTVQKKKQIMPGLWSGCDYIVVHYLHIQYVLLGRFFTYTVVVYL